MPKESEKKDEDIKKASDYNNPDGSMILLKKSDRDEEFYYAQTKSKKKGAKGAVKKEESGKGKSIKHDVATFQLFDKLKLDAPVNTDEIPALIEEYNEKVRQWELTREEQKRKILSGEVDPFAKKEEKKEEKEEEKEGEEEKEEEKEEEEE